MRLRIKLVFFTVFFVLIVSIIILAITVRQIQVKGRGDVERIRRNENLRVEKTLKEHVTVIYSLLDAQYKSGMSKEQILVFLEKVKGITYDEGRGHFWISAPGKPSTLIMHPYIGILSASDRVRLTTLTRIVDSIALSHGEGYYRGLWPKFDGVAFASGTYSMLCYAEVFKPLGWVVASGKYLDDVEEIIAARSDKIRQDEISMIKDRILYSIVILSAFTMLIIFFSSRITHPINRLVLLSEEITSGKRGYFSRMEVTSSDEIGRLAASFNKMLSHVEKTLAKLEENAAKYRELVENANSAIIRIDRNGFILFFNEYAQKIFGYTATEMDGKNILTLASLEDDTGMTQSVSDFNRIFQEAEANRYLENVCKTRSGSVVWMAWSNKPLYNQDGTLKEILCVGSDITARKKAEELAQIHQRKLLQTDKMATLGTLVSGIAHEINNPNNFIILNSENLKKFWTDILPVADAYSITHKDYALSGLPYAEARLEMPGLISGITDGAKRIKRIVQGLKDFARQETGIPHQRVNLRKVVDAAAIIVGGLIKKTTDHFSVTQTGEVPDVMGNSQQLEQVIINLMTNACQATFERTKPICVDISVDAEHRDVIVAVSDQGGGIKEEHLKHIMDPFFTTKRDSGGTGLGLSISYTIIKDHGGDLKIESKPGKGTCAKMILPILT